MSPFRQRLVDFIEHDSVQNTIMAIILINAVTLGLETSATVRAEIGGILGLIDELVLVVFVLELTLKIIGHGWRFFLNGWNIFDFVIVTGTLLPFGGNISVIRAFRVLRAFRLFSVVPKMRAMIHAFFGALPGMGAVVGVLGLFFYVFAVMTKNMYGEAFPDWFGTLGDSVYTLFQVMTLESWSMGIVRPVMDEFPNAWMVFVPFIVITAFAVLNLFIGVIVNSMQAIHEEERKDQQAALEEATAAETSALMSEIALLEQEIMALRQEIAAGHMTTPDAADPG